MSPFEACSWGLAVPIADSEVRVGALELKFSARLQNLVFSLCSFEVLLEEVSFMNSNGS